MIVCIDTNALLPILSLSHRWGVILDAWIAGRFVWFVTRRRQDRLNVKDRCALRDLRSLLFKIFAAREETKRE